MMQRTPGNPRSKRLALVCLLSVLLACTALLVAQPRLVLGVWYEGGLLNGVIPPSLQSVFDAVHLLRRGFWLVGSGLLTLLVLAWIGWLDRVARPLSIAVFVLLIAGVVAMALVRNEGAKESAFKRALLQD